MSISVGDRDRLLHHLVMGWAIRVGVVAAIAATSVVACATAPPAPPQIDVHAAWEHSSTFDTKPGSAEVAWAPAFVLANRDSEPVEVVDVETDFPARSVDGTQSMLDLVVAGPTTNVEIFRSRDEIRDDRPTTTQPPPVLLQPGETLYVRPEQHLTLVLGGEPAMIQTGKNPAGLLAQFLGVPTDPAGGYRCVLDAHLPVTVHTDRGDVGGEVDQALLVAGCTLKDPN